jgi:hypothetical protein
MIKSKSFDAAEFLGLNDPPPKKDVVPYRGVMIYGHKTAGTIQVMDAATYSNWKGYQPGRHGRSAVKKAGGKNTAHI